MVTQAAALATLLRPAYSGYESMLDRLTRADFLMHIGSKFRVRTDAELSTDLELIAAEPLSPRSAGVAPREPFSLVFRNSNGEYLPQQIYSLEHAVLGSLDIFLVPIGPDAQGMRFEAVFT